MQKYQTEIYVLILFSLAALFVKSLFALGFALLMGGASSSYLGLNVIQIALSILMLFFLLKEKKYTWIISILQIILVFFATEGTFSWAFNYIFKPIVPFMIFQKYFLSALLVVSEILKTVWIYKKEFKN